MIPPTIYDLEALLLRMLAQHRTFRICSDCDAARDALDALAVLAAHREAARRARPVVERWLQAGGQAALGIACLTGALSEAFESRPGQFAPAALMLAAYDRAHAEPPQPEPAPAGPVIRLLVEALGLLARGAAKAAEEKP